MLRGKDTDQKFYYNISLEMLVPQDHYLRHIDRLIDFDFIRNKVRHLYSHTGKPAIDPVVLFKMLLIGYLYDVKSERQLEKEIQVNLAYRWFIRYDLDEKIPDHSTISQTRRRKFVESNLFQEIFDEIVQKCMEKGLITGKTILTDSTYIRADASLDSLREIVITPQEFIQRLEENSGDSKPVKNNRSDGSDNNEDKKLSNKTHRSSSDPDSKLVSRKGSGKGLVYKEHRSLDKSGFITDVHVTAGNIADTEPYVARLQRQRDAFLFPIDSVVADRGYGTYHIYKDLTIMGIDAYIPETGSYKNQKNAFDNSGFIYNKRNDTYQCPAGHIMRRKLRKPRQGGIQYKASKLVCNENCPNRTKCTTTKNHLAREIYRNIYQDYMDHQLSKRNSRVWRALLKLRKTIVEGSFADAKENHGMRRAKFRGLKKVQEQSFMTAIAQNIKRMAKDYKKVKELPGIVQEISISCKVALVFDS